MGEFELPDDVGEAVDLERKKLKETPETKGADAREPVRADFASREEFFRASAEFWTRKANAHPAWSSFQRMEDERNAKMERVRAAFIEAQRRKSK